MDFESHGIFTGMRSRIETFSASHVFNGPISVCLLQDGMGQLKVVPGGLQLSGQAWVLDMLRASNIRSRYGQPITLGTSRISLCT